MDRQSTLNVNAYTASTAQQQDHHVEHASIFIQVLPFSLDNNDCLFRCATVQHRAELKMG